MMRSHQQQRHGWLWLKPTTQRRWTTPRRWTKRRIIYCFVVASFLLWLGLYGIPAGNGWRNMPFSDASKKYEALPPPLPTVDYRSVCLTNECMEREGRRLARAFPDRPVNSWFVPKSHGSFNQTSQEWQGLLLVRPYKAASSTLAGIALRISHRHDRHKNSTRSSSHENQDGSGGCAVQWGHARGQISDYLTRRSKSRSFLFAPVRRAADRAYSSSFFFVPSDSGYKSDDVILADFHKQMRQWPGGLIYNYLWGTGRSKSNFTKMMQESPAGIHARIQEMIHEHYDFLVVVERFDESVTALALLTGLHVGDVLVQSTKVAGGARSDKTSAQEESIRYTRKNGQCMEHRQQKMSSGIRNYTTTSHEWLYWNYADTVLWHAANASLDQTIDRLGRTRFEAALTEYRMYKKRVEATYPEPQGCTPGMPADQIQQGCYSQDFGCGYQFVDRVIRQVQKERAAEEKHG